jgi:hypothetical protein
MATAMTCGPKPGVDYTAMAAEAPKLSHERTYRHALFEATPLIFATLIDPNSRIRRRDTAEVAGNSGAVTLDRLALAALPFARHQAVAR